MKASLLLKNIGGLREGQFSFKSDKLNVIESGNSGGKSTIVKAMVAVLSVPRTGAFDQALKEAEKVGIKTDPRNPYEGFVNIYASQGSVQLQYDGNKEEYVVSQNGDVRIAPENGDERFLLTGILSGNSRVLRQLRGFDNREPDDFRWAVDELSLAQRYSLVSDSLKTELEDIGEIEKKAQSSQQELEPMKQNQVAIETRLQTLDLELGKLKEKYVESGKWASEKDKSQKTIASLEGEKQRASLELRKRDKEERAPILTEIKSLETSRLRQQDELKATEAEIVKLEAEQEKRQEIEGEVNNLINQRNALDGLLNLYVVAEANLRKDNRGETTCPLCQQGRIDYTRIQQSVLDLREQRSGLNQKILQRNQERQTIAIRLSKAQDKAEELREAIRQDSDRINFVKKRLRPIEEAVWELERRITEYEKSLERERLAFRELDSKIGKADEAVNAEYNQKSEIRGKLQEESGRILQRTSELSSIELYGVRLATDVAVRACESIRDLLVDRISYLMARAEEEREAAARKFNDSVTELMRSLMFTEFREVRLSGAPSYRLYVERFDAEKKEYKSQNVSTLSTSEKSAIALILQMAIKETYMKKVPFMIFDDVLEEFDQERRSRVIEYLRQRVGKESGFTIITRLAENVEVPRVTYI